VRSSDRVAAGVLFIVTASLPTGIWLVFLFAGNSGAMNWFSNLEYAVSAESGVRGYFIFLAASSVFSFAAAAILLAKRPSRTTLTAFLIGGGAQCLAYVAWSAWVPAAIAATPLVWLGRAYKTA
jgi:hypothetical protein